MARRSQPLRFAEIADATIKMENEKQKIRNSIVANHQVRVLKTLTLPGREAMECAAA